MTSVTHAEQDMVTTRHVWQFKLKLSRIQNFLGVLPTSRSQLPQVANGQMVTARHIKNSLRYNAAGSDVGGNLPKLS